MKKGQYCQWSFLITHSFVILCMFVRPGRSLLSRSSSQHNYWWGGQTRFRLQSSSKMSSTSSTFSMNNNDNGSDNMKKKNLVVVIAGPTATGKSDVAARLCSEEWFSFGYRVVGVRWSIDLTRIPSNQGSVSLK